MTVEINSEEVIGKTVGRRSKIPPLEVSVHETDSCRQWRKAGYGPRINKGVYRFNSHEEADQWLMKQLTKKQDS